MSAFIQYTLQGLAAGGFYALSALGLAVIFGVLGVVIAISLGLLVGSALGRSLRGWLSAPAT